MPNQYPKGKLNKNDKGQKIKVGDIIKVGTPTGENFGYDYYEEIYKVTDIKINPYNNVVPYIIFLNNKPYIPTSASDGHWEDSLHLGFYEILPSPNRNN